MADPKYANLYGIAHDQPDVYETNDLPEVDQVTDIFEEKSESIDRLCITGPDAFNLFKGKEADATTVDFSKIRKNRIGSYGVRFQDWELAGEGEEETRAQKFNRLKLEVEDLIAEVSTFSEDKAKDLSDLSQSVIISTDAVHNLLAKVVDTKLADKVGSESQKGTKNEAEHLATLTKRLNAVQAKLEGKNLKETSVSIETNDNNVEDGVKLHLQVQPSHRALFTARATELERKINKLETIVGSNNGQAVRLCNMNIDDGLLNCCQWMIAKLSLLDSTQLDVVESKMNNVNSRLEQILSNQANIVQCSEKDKKINELYELSEKAREKSDLINTVVQRMVALESLHQQGKLSLQTVAHLEKVQSELAQNLANNETKINNIKDSMKANLESIKKNIESLEKRIDSLKGKK